MTIFYPDVLANNEITSHLNCIHDYYKDLSINLFEQADKNKPDLSLIAQQPQLTPQYRAPLLDFLFKISKRTKVCPSTYPRSVRLLDRYCSKRIVLLDQAQLVATTCLWIVAKTDGGCNHCAPSLGARFSGPTQRARIPRLAELSQLCGPTCGYDEGMFVQMERHILDTLNWNVTEPSVSDWCFETTENNTITNYLSTKQKSNVALKHFIIDSSLYTSKLIPTHPAELAASLINIFNTVQSRLSPSLLHQNKQSFTSPLILPSTNMEITSHLLQSIVNSSPTLQSYYADQLTQPYLASFIQQSSQYLALIQRSRNSTSPYDSEEDSDTDSLFDQIAFPGSNSPSPLPSPDKFIFNNTKRPVPQMENSYFH